MIRAGVLSGAYKFKVMTLDAEGLSHLVLIDIQPSALQTVAEGQDGLERDLKELARERLSLDVRAVYWRWSVPNTASPAAAPRTPPSHAEAMDTLQRALSAQDPGPDSRLGRGFEPTRPMQSRTGDDFDLLSKTQLGELR